MTRSARALDREAVARIIDPAAWDTEQPATTHFPHPDYTWEMHQFGKQQIALAKADAILALASPTDAPPVQPPENNYEDELQRTDSGMHAAGAGQNGVVSGDDAGEADLRRPEIRSEKRCFTYCGDDKCDCGLAEGISLERNAQARLAERRNEPPVQPPAWEAAFEAWASFAQVKPRGALQAAFEAGYEAAETKP